MNFLSPPEVVKFASEVMKKKCCYGTRQTLLMGFLAGVYIAMGGYAANVASFDIASASTAKFMSGAVFPVGLILVVVAGGELFTGNCLIPLGLYNRNITVFQIVKNWSLVYASNFVGAVFFAWLIWQTGLASGGIRDAAVNTAAAKSSIQFWPAFVRGILCNWLVSIAVWISFAANDIAGKILAMWFPVMVFVMCGYEHSVANMYFIPLGIFLDGGATPSLGIGGLINNLIPVTFGNIVGASVFIASAYALIFPKSLEGN